MGRDYTKYSVDNETFVGKGKLARLVLEKFIVANGHMPLAKFQEIFKDEIQGSAFLRSKEDVESNYDRKRFDPVEVISDDATILVSNQWGTHNIDTLLNLCEQINVSVYDNRETETIASKEDDSVLGTPKWKLPEALACVIRHIMIADGRVIEGELNWMQVAFKEFGEVGINVYDAWDDVNDHAQVIFQNDPMLYEFTVDACITFLSRYLPENMRMRLIQILMQIAAQDDSIHEREHQWIRKVADAFYPGHAQEIVTDVFKNSNML